MAEAQYAHNHIVNPETGFIESNAYLSAFDSERKLAYLRLFVENGLDVYTTCEQLSLSPHTVNKHYQIDSVFREKIDEAKAEYASKLDGVSKRNAMNPKSVIERIFQLKSLYPEKYADLKGPSTASITINVGSVVGDTFQKNGVIDVTPIQDATDALRDPGPASTPPEQSANT